MNGRNKYILISISQLAKLVILFDIEMHIQLYINVKKELIAWGRRSSVSRGQLGKHTITSKQVLIVIIYNLIAF